MQNEPIDGKLQALLDLDAPATLSAASTSDAAGGVAYIWNITRKDATGVMLLPALARAVLAAEP